MKVFLDTSAFVALAQPHDPHHAEAREKRARLAAERHTIHTSNAVLYHTLNWLAVRMGPKSAAQFGRSVFLRSPSLRIVPLEAEDQLGAVAVLEKYPALALSFVDASSLHLFHKMDMDRLFSFNPNFTKAEVALL